MSFRPLLTLIALSSFPASADGLGDLKAALLRLTGTEAVRGSLSVRYSRQTLEDKKPVLHRGNGSAWLEDGPKGLRIVLGKEALDMAAAEGRAQAKNPESNAPHRIGLRELDALDIAELLNHADPLLRYLDKATLQGEKREIWNGRPARVISLKVDPPLPQSQRRHLKKLDVNARIWIGDDGAPLALNYQAAYSGSRFFITFRGSIQEERRFAVLGDRLLVLHRSLEESASGLGMSSQIHRVATFAPEK